jgi:hypothetical protein
VHPANASTRPAAKTPGAIKRFISVPLEIVDGKALPALTTRRAEN